MLEKPRIPEDFLDLAVIHKNELKNGGFVSRCGINFIKFFYEKISKYDSSVLLIDKYENGKVAGFIFCTTDHNEFYTRFLKENFFAVFRFRNLFFSLIRTAFKKIFSPPLPDYNAELVNVAVRSDDQGKGIAKLLIDEAEKILKKSRVYEYYLQVFEDNTNAVNLYNKIGFHIAKKIKIKDRQKLIMKKNI